MSTKTNKLHDIVGMIWKHISASVALVLIVGALMLGYSMGQPSETETEASIGGHDHTTDTVAADEYTCSMHPSVRLPDADAKCPICFMDLIPVAAGSQDGGDLLTLSESAVALSRIETMKAGRFFPSAEVRLYGKLGYDETSVARISAYFPGRIDRLFVNYVGVTVNEGDHLAEMYSPELLAAFEELRQAKKSLDQSESASDFMRDTARQIMDASREKLRLFGISQEQIARVEGGEFDSDQLTVYSPIGGVVTRLAAREGDYLETGDRIATVANLSRLWLDLEAYESDLPLLRWGLPITFTVEAHPGEVFEGRVSFIEPMVDDRTRTAAVRVAVDNTDGRLNPGMFATAIARPKVAADGVVVSDDLAGKWVCPMHPTIVLDLAGSCDICGMDVVSAESLGIVGDPSLVETPLVIPRSAVLFTGTRSIVYVRVVDQEEPTYEGRVVQLGPLAGNFYTVRTGIDEGEDIVVHGAFRVDSAMQLLAKPSMMMPGGGRGGTIHNHGGDDFDLSSKDTESTAPNSFIEGLDPVYGAYLNAQERLADDDLGGFLEAVIDLNTSIISVNTSGLSGESLGLWTQSSKQLSVGLDGADIEVARHKFEMMTAGVMALQDRFGNPRGETLHVAFCPMAFDFKGAQWIQRGTEINNPYFGDAMLRCGEIQEMLESTQDSDHKGHVND